MTSRIGAQAPYWASRRPDTLPCRGAGVGSSCDTAVAMSRHTTFKFCLDPTVEQQNVLARHVGASRFAFNQCLRIVKSALTQRHRRPEYCRAVDRIRSDKCVQCMEEDRGCGPGLCRRCRRCSPDTGHGACRGGRRCTSRYSRKPPSTAGARWLPGRTRALVNAKDTRSVFLGSSRRASPRNRSVCGTGTAWGASPPSSWRQKPRSVTLPRVGTVLVHNDTRTLRRMLANDRAKILFATVTQRAGRWWVSLNVEAADLHFGRHHASTRSG